MQSNGRGVSYSQTGPGPCLSSASCGLTRGPSSPGGAGLLFRGYISCPACPWCTLVLVAPWHPVERSWAFRRSPTFPDPHGGGRVRPRRLGISYGIRSLPSGPLRPDFRTVDDMRASLCPDGRVSLLYRRTFLQAITEKVKLGVFYPRLRNQTQRRLTLRTGNMP